MCLLRRRGGAAPLPPHCRWYTSGLAWLSGVPNGLPAPQRAPMCVPAQPASARRWRPLRACTARRSLLCHVLCVCACNARQREGAAARWRLHRPENAPHTVPNSLCHRARAALPAPAPARRVHCIAASCVHGKPRRAGPRRPTSIRKPPARQPKRDDGARRRRCRRLRARRRLPPATSHTTCCRTSEARRRGHAPRLHRASRSPPSPMHGHTPACAGFWVWLTRVGGPLRALPHQWVGRGLLGLRLRGTPPPPI